MKPRFLLDVNALVGLLWSVHSLHGKANSWYARQSPQVLGCALTELSFIRASHRREKIHKFGHMHLDDLLERADRFKNELIICAHFSTRYHPQEVRRIVESKLPPSLRGRVRLWL